jgi:hypothetical protein
MGGGDGQQTEPAGAGRQPAGLTGVWAVATTGV